MRFRWALAAAASLALTAPAAPAFAAPAVATSVPASTASLVFGACPTDIAQSFPALTCATLPVPVDYSRPFGARISLLVTKHAAKDPAKRLGSLVLNPGGPGGGGAAYAGTLTKPDSTGFTRLAPAVLDAYDVIGFDPRGVAHSSAISCTEPDYFGPPQPDPDLQANRDQLWKIWAGYADGCATKAGALLPHLGTENVARDLDGLRASLGDAKLNYLGFSYGTYLGTVYGKLYPHNVGRMIIDGNIDPTPEDVWYQASLNQAAAMQKRFDSYLAWIAQYDNVFHLGKTTAEVRAGWTKALTDFRTNPRDQVGGSELLSTASGMMYSESNWTPFAHAISAYVVNGDDGPLTDFAAPYLGADAEEGLAAFNAVVCSDSVWPHDRATWERDTAEVAKTSQFAWYNVFTSPCHSWPVPSTNRPDITGDNLPGILMFNTVGDPATPYEGALRLHAALPTSVLVTERDSGKHCVFANSRSSVNQAANAIGTKYLLTGELPSADTSVAGHPLPVPTSAAPKVFKTTRATPVE
ncbi:alpha/beta hydrolase [Kribbella sp. NPDC005582]|uniref:alpha/beta hydrolase n=1 Tax=Kribbella sp. NPDC005582 TaxID=3156893 RepID=UPI0033B7945E